MAKAERHDSYDEAYLGWEGIDMVELIAEGIGFLDLRRLERASWRRWGWQCR